jgi:hypothetical protein
MNKPAIVNFLLQWSATILTIAGAIFTSLNVYPLNVITFNVGSILWLWFAIRVKQTSLIVVNAAMLLVYVFGLIRSVLL